jgi:predicted RNA-binding Zn-ribbon protein involved in translation (DUF1610 family)
MERAMAKQARKLLCPSCGTSIHFRHDKNGIGTCPQCGEWLVQRSWLRRRLEVVDDEAKGSAFDESTEWERALIDKIE